MAAPEGGEAPGAGGLAPQAAPEPEPAPRAPGRSRLPAWSLALGVLGVVLGWLPVAGRFCGLALGLAAAALGAAGMRRAAYGVKGSRRDLAVAGLALGLAAAAGGLRGFGVAALGSAVVGLLAS